MKLLIGILAAWLIFGCAGKDGAQGPQGPTGPTGPSGVFVPTNPTLSGHYKGSWYDTRTIVDPAYTYWCDYDLSIQDSGSGITGTYTETNCDPQTSPIPAQQLVGRWLGPQDFDLNNANIAMYLVQNINVLDGVIMPYADPVAGAPVPAFFPTMAVRQ